MDRKPLQKEQITSKKEQILASGERNKSKRAGLWESQSTMRVEPSE